jgi:hypothetical protein
MCLYVFICGFIRVCIHVYIYVKNYVKKALRMFDLTDKGIIVYVYMHLFVDLYMYTYV